MKIGLWNLDHPKINSKRFIEITHYLETQNCDILILTEANAAMELPGFKQYTSEESCYLNKQRCYDPPNKYHQVIIYSKLTGEQFTIEEPINGVLFKIEFKKQPLLIYGNVITIKDQWKKESNKKYKDRLDEQVLQFSKLLGNRFFIGGDFNLKKGWKQKQGAYREVEDFVKQNKLKWPTT